jgi:hypothetical protein
LGWGWRSPVPVILKNCGYFCHITGISIDDAELTVSQIGSTILVKGHDKSHLAVYIYQFFMSNLESCVARSAKDAA